MNEIKEVSLIRIFPTKSLQLPLKCIFVIQAPKRPLPLDVFFVLGFSVNKTFIKVI